MPKSTKLLSSLRRACIDNALNTVLENVNELEKRGYDWQFGDGHGWTVLHYASWHGSLEVAELLLERRAEVNATDKSQKTPLDYARHDGVRSLLEGRGGQRRRQNLKRPRSGQDYDARGEDDFEQDRDPSDEDDLWGNLMHAYMGPWHAQHTAGGKLDVEEGHASPDDVSRCTVILEGASGCDPSELIKVFSVAGYVLSSTHCARTKTVAITFSEPSAAIEAVRRFNGTTLHGRVVTVYMEGQRPPQRTETSSSGASTSSAPGAEEEQPKNDGSNTLGQLLPQEHLERVREDMRRVCAATRMAQEDRKTEPAAEASSAPSRGSASGSGFATSAAAFDVEPGVAKRQKVTEGSSNPGGGGSSCSSAASAPARELERHRPVRSLFPARSWWAPGKSSPTCPAGPEAVGDAVSHTENTENEVQEKTRELESKLDTRASQRIADLEEQLQRALQEKAASERRASKAMEKEAASEMAVRRAQEEAAASEHRARKAMEREAASEMAVRRAQEEAAAFKQKAHKDLEEYKAASEKAMHKAQEEKAASEHAARKALDEKAASDSAARKAQEEQAASEEVARRALEERDALERAVQRALEEKAASDRAACKAQEEQVASEQATLRVLEEKAALQKAAQDATELHERTASQLAAHKAELAQTQEAIKVLQGRVTSAEESYMIAQREKEDLEALLKMQQPQKVHNASEEGVCWKYEQGKMWYDMGQDANRQLIVKYKEYLDPTSNAATTRRVQITSSGRNYEVDFKDMAQTNPKSGRPRKIKVVVDVPQCWTTGPEALLKLQATDDIWVWVEKSNIIWTTIERLLQQTAHGTGDNLPNNQFAGSRCTVMRDAKIQALYRVENFLLWRKYADHLRQMSMEEQAAPTICEGSLLAVQEDTKVFFNATSWEPIARLQSGDRVKAAGPPDKHLEWKYVPIIKQHGDHDYVQGVVALKSVAVLGRLESTVEPRLGTLAPDVEAITKVLDEQFPRTPGVNEQWLFHGTTRESLEKIVASGFDSRISKNGLYGMGTYFTSQSCKAHQYTCEKCPRNAMCECNSSHAIILARVAVGCPHYATKGRKHERIRRPPPRADCGNRLHDSVVASPGPMPGAPMGEQFHQEFVVFENDQAYPSFAVIYTA